MNALKARRRYDEEQEIKRWEAYRKAEEEKYAAMTEEEREAYRKEKSERNRRVAQTLGMMSAMMNGPYSSEAARDVVSIMSKNTD